MDTTPVSLLEQLRKPQQQRAWERFAELYTPLLYYWARSQGLAEADAADLVQEVFVILVNKLPSFRYDRDGSFRAWLHTVTLNKHRELRRKKTPQAVDDLDQHPDKNGQSSLDEKEYRLHLIQRMLAILKPQLPPSTWQLFEPLRHRRPATASGGQGASGHAGHRLRREVTGAAPDCARNCRGCWNESQSPSRGIRYSVPAGIS